MAEFEYYEALIIWLNLAKYYEFIWDDGNKFKNEIKHNVTNSEIEEVFTERKWVPLGRQTRPAFDEERHGIIGLTKTGRKLMVSFTLKSENIRVISARPMSRTERKIYEQEYGNILR